MKKILNLFALIIILLAILTPTINASSKNPENSKTNDKITSYIVIGIISTISFLSFYINMKKNDN